jgi:hypothetical protein
MIPTNPTNLSKPQEEVLGVTGSKRHVLFVLRDWEIVVYAERQKAYAVHNCHAQLLDHDTKEPMVDGILKSSPPRAITRSIELLKPWVTCWSCHARVPDEIITVTELYNGG